MRIAAPTRPLRVLLRVGAHGLLIAAICAVVVVASAHNLPSGSQTALVVLQLQANGSVDIGWAEPKPVLWSEGHREARPEEQMAPLGPTLPDRPHKITVVVDHPTLKHALAVDIDLPHESGGDVVGAWKTGSMMVRVPFVGYGTQYIVVRETAYGPFRLSEWVVER